MIDIPLCLAIISGLLNCKRASKVALTTLWGFDEPWDFDKTSFTPTVSNTALTAPPAITPVPSEAGFRKTLAPPNLPFCSWGNVPFLMVIFIRFFLASSTALAIASDTSFDFPRPWPTIPFSSPTTTIAEKPKFLPP